MISPDLFERARSVPETLNSTERVVFGVAAIQSALGVPGAVDEKVARLGERERTELLVKGIDVTKQGLREIRADPQLSEAARFSTASIVLSELDWKAISLNPSVETVGLFAETMLTVGAGLRTRIQERIGELREGTVDGFYRMAAICMLGDTMGALTADGQIRHILNADLHTPKDRRTIALTWAKHLAGEVNDEQFGGMLRFYGQEMNDMEAVFAISAVKLKALKKRDSVK